MGSYYSPFSSQSPVKLSEPFAGVIFKHLEANRHSIQTHKENDSIKTILFTI
jgi:hypothetical protein